MKRKTLRNIIWGWMFAIGVATQWFLIVIAQPLDWVVIAILVLFSLMVWGLIVAFAMITDAFFSF